MADAENEMKQQSQTRTSGGLQLVVAWTLVGVPLAWGIYKTLEKALVLFR